MQSPTENFSAISPVTNDQSSSVLHELRVLSERPTPPQTQTLPGQDGQAPSVAYAPPEQPVASQISTDHLPAVSMHDDAAAHPKPEESKLGLIPNELLNLGIAAGAIWGAEAIGAVVFRSPQLAEMALQTAAGSAKVGLAAETAVAATKFGFLSGETAQLYGKVGIWTGTYGAGIAARHYSYEALTGQKESWFDSANQVGKGVIALMLTRQAMRMSDKVWPTS